MTDFNTSKPDAPDNRIWEPIKVADMNDDEFSSFIRLMIEGAAHAKAFLAKAKPQYSSSNPRPLPTQEILRWIFDYDEKAGCLIWKTPPSKSQIKAGTAAGGLKSGGYVSIKLNGVEYKAHRLVYVWHLGMIPSGAQIDHIDRNKANNRVENLRLCSASENGRNRPVQSNNAEGLKGAYLHEKGRCWQAVIRFQRSNYFLGLYKTREDAHRAYATAARAIHGEFMHHSIQSVEPLPRDHKVWLKIAKIPGASVPLAMDPQQFSLSLDDPDEHKKCSPRPTTSTLSQPNQTQHQNCRQDHLRLTSMPPQPPN